MYSYHIAMTSKFKLTLILRVLSSVSIIGCGLPLGSVGSNPLKYTSGVTYRYLYETRTTLNGEKTHSKGDIGFNLSAVIHLSPVWANDDVLVFKLEILEPRLGSVSRGQLSYDLKQLSRSSTYFQWNKGHVTQVLASDDESISSLNLKRGIISLFQVSPLSGTQSEIDVSGDCRIVYHQSSDSDLKKSKILCSSLDSTEQLKQTNEIFGVNVTFSSQTDYVIANSVIASASSEESYVSVWNMESSLSPTVYSKQTLTLINTVQSKSVIQATTLETVLKKLGKDKKGKLYATVLPASHERFSCSSSACPPATEIVAKYREYLDGKLTGSINEIDIFLSAVAAFREASRDTILSILKDKLNTEIILPLIDVSTAAQTVASQSALMDLIKFNDESNLQLAERYLLAVAMATHPATSTVTDLLKLFRENIPNEQLRESIGDALGAVINTYKKRNQNHKIISDVEKALMDKLSNCGSNLQCQLASVRSIGNAQLPGTLTTLCELALTSPHASVSETALNALFKLDTATLSTSLLVNDIVRKIFYQRSHRGYDTAARSQALRILLTLSTLTEQDVEDILMASLDPWNTDYNMFIQASLFDTAKRNESFKSAVKRVLAKSKLNNYDVLAPKGKSLSFTSDLTETTDFVSTYRMFVENGRSGIMKRSGMDVDISSSSFKMPVFSFKLYAAGLESLVGEPVDEDEKDIEVTAGLSLDLLRVSLRPVSFFTGQGGLMSALWNAPSELTPALQTNVLIQDLSRRVNLQNGLIVELNMTGAVSMSLAGSLSVSLWNKNAESLIKNRGAVKLFSRLSVMTSSFRASVQLDSHTESFIDFRSDVNFYDGVIMCLQMSRPNSQYRTTITKEENSRGFKTSYRSRKTRSKNIYALSYPLPRLNSENCRKMLSSL